MNMDEMKEEYARSETARDGCRRLTARELQIIKLSAKGLKHSEVAEKLGIGKRTVATHNYKAFKKIGAKNIIEAINHVEKYYKG